ncbi:hypothetical protein RhiLY_05031 [Ceratobasidium sp. AG-Ba]|nr:hypothetical protein RhiLY_05031 [Ceratobasidium sp. AG-Ba]
MLLAHPNYEGVKGISVTGDMTMSTNPAACVEPLASTTPTTPTQSTRPVQSAIPARQTAETWPMVAPIERAQPVPRALPIQQAMPAQRAVSGSSVPTSTTRQTATATPSSNPTDSVDSGQPTSAAQSLTTIQSTTTRSTAPSRSTTSSRAVRLNASNGPLAVSCSNRPSTGSLAAQDIDSTNPPWPQPKIPILRKLTTTESETLQRQLVQLRSGGRTINLKFIGLKPDYDIVRDIMKYALEHTPGIDMSQTSTKQMVEDLIDAAVEQVLLALPEFEPYKMFEAKSEKRESECQESELQESEHQESEHQGFEHQEAEHQDFAHQDFMPQQSDQAPGIPKLMPRNPNPQAYKDANAFSNGTSDATIDATTRTPTVPYASPTPKQQAQAIVPTARLGNVAALAKDVNDMSLDVTGACNNDDNPSPFSLPPDLAGAPKWPSAMDMGPDPAPVSSFTPSTPAQPTHVMIHSTATATATARSVSKATSTVSAPRIPTSPRGSNTPLGSRDNVPISPSVLRKVQDLRLALSASQRSRLPPTVQKMISALEDLDSNGLPIDAQAVLAATPSKHDASRPPPYSEPDFNPDGDEDDASELSDAPSHKGGLNTDMEDMEVDEVVGTSTNRKGKQRVQAQAAHTKQGITTGGKTGGAVKKKGNGKAITMPNSAGGSGSNSATQDQPARRSGRQKPSVCCTLYK